jgi:3-hydroxyacyl-CoA dehydrogenase
MSKLLVRKVAVLGAGVMGAQIAAHLANARVPVALFDLPAREGPPNGIVDRAIESLKKLEPSPLAGRDTVRHIEAANYDQHLPKLADCDVVIEAISERMDWKQALYERVAPHLAPGAIFASNTSGLSINTLARSCPASMRPRFCGIHFFNPPRYMHLVELIPQEQTEPGILDALETFLVTTLGKGVVRAKDTPNFVANRVGVFSILATMHHTEAFGLGFDVVDALTGPVIGRAKSATYRTADVVGLDTLAHVIRTMQETLPDDPWHRYYAPPAWLSELVDKGALGQKTKAGFFRKMGKEIQVLDLAQRDYRPSAGQVDPGVQEILKLKNPAEKFARLRESSHPQGQFMWAIFRDLFHYCAVHLQGIAHTARDVDLAIRWGFGWQMGPFETWQAAGWQQVAKWVAEDVAAGKAMTKVPLPGWVADGRNGVHGSQGSYSAETGSYAPRSALPVYARQYFPETVLGEAASDPAKAGTTVYENEGVRLWHTGDDIAILSFRSKLNTIGDEVLEGTLRAIEEAEKNFAGLVVWQTREPFSAGANLAAMGPAVQAGQFKLVESHVAKFQQTTQRLKYSLVPVVGAARGMALGGGCEFLMHCDRVVAALESYLGLVEVGVGLLPAGGGLKELALRAAREAKARDPSLESTGFLRAYFQMVAMATVSKSAIEAKELGYLREPDTVVFNAHELLHVAKAQARALADTGYRPPLPARDIPVGGKTGISVMQMMLVNMRDGGFISPYDYEIGTRVARVICGGEVEAGSLVDEKWLLDLERAEFMALLAQGKTQERIRHMLETGRPLRN